MIKITTSTNEPIYKQIYLQLKEDILSGHMPYNKRLPATRTLAEQLNVSRNTINMAYRQLEIEGYVSVKQSSGYYVNKISTLNQSSPKYSKNTNREEFKPKIKYNFQHGTIDSTTFPISKWKKCLNYANDAIYESLKFTSIEKEGLYELRSSIANHLYEARGVDCTPEEVVITSGHQNSLEILSKLFINSEYSFSMENPGYNVTRNTFEHLNYKMNFISLEDDGICIDEVKTLSSTLLCVTPSHQFPMGAVLPITKRIDLLSWANENNSYIIEDDYDSELRYHSLLIPSLYSLDINKRTIYLGTFSKSLSPDLRISYMVLPPPILSKYQESYKICYNPVSKIIQLAMSKFIRDSDYEKHLNIIRTFYKKKNNLLISSILKYFKNDAEILGGDAGLHIIIRFKFSLDREKLIKKTVSNHILLYPLDILWANPSQSPDNLIILGFGSIKSKDMEDAVKQLYNIVNDSIL